MPLHGESRPYKDFSFANLADDMKNILYQEGIDEVVLVGQSYKLKSTDIILSNMLYKIVFYSSIFFY